MGNNVVGKAEKTFNVHLISKPKIEKSEKVSQVEVDIGSGTTLECPILDSVGVEIIWFKNEIPITPDQKEFQILSNGRHLHIPAMNSYNTGNYICEAKNEAGSTKKDFKIDILSRFNFFS